MTANEEKVLKIVKKIKGKAHSSQIAKELEISSGYADLILKALQRRGKIEYFGGWAFLPQEVEEIAKKEVRKKKAKKVKEKKVKSSLMKLQGMTEELEKSLQKAGYKDIRALAEVSVARLMEDTGLKLKMAANLINGARKILKIIPNITSDSEQEKGKPREKKEKPKKTTTHPPSSHKRAPKQEKTTKRKEEKRITWPTKLLHRLFR